MATENTRHNLREAVRRFLKALLFVVVQALLVLLLLEAGASVYNRYQIRPGEPVGWKTDATTRSRESLYHPILGWDCRPNSGPSWEHQNSFGNRSPEYSIEKPPGKKRVLIIGDSQAWGMPVFDPFTIQSVLAGLLPADRYEVISLGVPGYSPEQTLLKYLLKGRILRPDYVVFIFFEGNDFRETGVDMQWSVAKPQVVMSGGEYCLRNIPCPGAGAWPAASLGDELLNAAPWLRQSFFGFSPEHSALLELFRRRKVRHDIRVSDSLRDFVAPVLEVESSDVQKVREFFPCLNPKEWTKPDVLELVWNLILMMKRAANEDGAQFLLYSVPEHVRVSSGERGEWADEILRRLPAAGIPFRDAWSYWIDSGRSSRMGEIYSGAHLSKLADRAAAYDLYELLSGPEGLPARLDRP